jgi:uncharacterized repeat protein (TIGR02543 family)
MATISKWTPFGVALDITATGGTVTRTSATKFTVKINASWETYYNGAQTKYGMIASSGGSSVTLKTFNNTAASSGSGSFTGTYSISGNGSATKSIVVTFRNFNDDNGDSATKNVTFSVNVPAWTSYTVTYSANGGTGAPSSQTKWKDQTLTLSGTKPTRNGYSFLGWSTSSTSTTATYSAGGSYTSNANATLYAVWKANTYTVRYNANGGSGAPGNQTKTYGKTLTLSSTKPTRTNYTFKGWATTASATTATYSAGGSYTANAAATLYAVWELSYVKPQITNLSASRCNSNGTASDSGTYALIKFKWTATIAKPTITVVCANTSGTTVGTYNITSSGTNGTVSQVVGNGSFNVETSYTFTVTVADTNDNTDRVVTMSGTEFHMDFSKDSVAIGKPAETLIGTGGAKFKAFDVKWRAKFRECLCVGDKLFYHDGNQGIFLSHEGYMHLQRTTAQGFHPYIGFYLDDATTAGGQIRLNSSSKLMEFLNAAGYYFGSDLYMKNNESVMGYDSNGTAYNAFQAKNESNNTVVGYDNYANASGNTNIYGYDINFGVANISNPGTYRPYRRKGDSFSLTLRTSGYVTNSSKDVSFWIPLAEPIVGSPTVSITSGDGFVFRQGSQYTHGSTASAYAKPVSYEATATMFNGIYVKAVFSNTTNATNNDSIGIYWNGTITLS